MTLLMVMMLFSDDGGGDGGDNMQKFHGMSSVSFAHDRSRKTLKELWASRQMELKRTFSASTKNKP